MATARRSSPIGPESPVAGTRTQVAKSRVLFFGPVLNVISVTFIRGWKCGWGAVLLLPMACQGESAALEDDGSGGIASVGEMTTGEPMPEDTETDPSSGSDTSGGSESGEVCGDGERGITEACDDGNVEASDGCDAQCGVEPLYRCPVPGLPCIPIVCGDGKVESPETCDDHNDASGDGCDDACALEAGYVCPFPGAACQSAECGDGVLAGFESCDDGNSSAGDGCDPTCRLEPGFYCPAVGAPCETTTCGDSLTQGTEHCDDGNLVPYDGCSPSCTNEPSCSGGECEAICGDGVILPGPAEECDDGNTIDGDGCSSSCAVEEGFECTLVDVDLPETLRLPVIYRDFRGWNHPDEPRHPDFNNRSGSGITFGMLADTLDADRLPIADPLGPKGGGSVTTDAQFLEWYRDTPGTNRMVTDVLELAFDNGSYELDTNAFFPINGRGWTEDATDPQAELRYNRATSEYSLTEGDNFNFTSEMRYWFQFEGDEVLDFRGDDDVWVFVDGQLCLDIGGIHGAESATMDFGNPASEANATQRTIVQACADRLEVGRVYEVAVFHAERRVVASNFRLTLSGFVTQASECDWVCGDGIVTAFEVCDDGVEENTGEFGKCTPDCLGIGPFCGDGARRSRV